MATVEIYEVLLPSARTARAKSHAALRAIAAARPGSALSLSHTDGLALIAIAGGRVGVDVEHVTNRPADADLEDLVALTLAEHERAALGPAGPLGWLQLWTRKEAVLKATGPSSLVDSAIRDIDAFADGARELELGPDHVGAVAVAAGASRIVQRRWRDA